MRIDAPSNENLGKSGEIQIRPTQHYPKLKSYLSQRDIPPFKNVWSVIKEYKKTKRHADMVFDREGPAGPTWFREYRETPTAAELSGALTDAIGAAVGMPYTLKDGRVLNVKVHRQKTEKRGAVEVSRFYLQLMDGERLSVDAADVVKMERPQEPARRLRRFWETQMRKHGLHDLLKASSGHDAAVGEAHYIKYETLVKATVMPKL